MLIPNLFLAGNSWVARCQVKENGGIFCFIWCRFRGLCGLWWFETDSFVLISSSTFFKFVLILLISSVPFQKFQTIIRIRKSSGHHLAQGQLRRTWSNRSEASKLWQPVRACSVRACQRLPIFGEASNFPGKHQILPAKSPSLRLFFFLLFKGPNQGQYCAGGTEIAWIRWSVSWLEMQKMAI